MTGHCPAAERSPTATAGMNGGKAGQRVSEFLVVAHSFRHCACRSEPNCQPVSSIHTHPACRCTTDSGDPCHGPPLRAARVPEVDKPDSNRVEAPCPRPAVMNRQDRQNGESPGLTMIIWCPRGGLEPTTAGIFPGSGKSYRQGTGPRACVNPVPGSSAPQITGLAFCEIRQNPTAVFEVTGRCPARCHPG